jgi:hypothetical protein
VIFGLAAYVVLKLHKECVFQWVTVLFSKRVIPVPERLRTLREIDVVDVEDALPLHNAAEQSPSVAQSDSDVLFSLESSSDQDMESLSSDLLSQELSSETASDVVDSDVGSDVDSDVELSPGSKGSSASDVEQDSTSEYDSHAQL